MCNERWDQIATLTRQGLTPPVIADLLHISTRTVGRARRKRGLAQAQHSKPLNAAEVERAKAFLDDGQSYAEVKRTMGCTRWALCTALPGYAYTRSQVAETALFGRMMASLERHV
jgi:Ser/Thr protein kinase RdoA (MazF antagonist)